MFHVANKSDKEKLVIHHATDNDATGNSDAPRSVEQVAKRTNISNVIDRIELNSASGSSNFTSGDEIVVLGWDPLAFGAPPPEPPSRPAKFAESLCPPPPPPPVEIIEVPLAGTILEFTPSDICNRLEQL